MSVSDNTENKRMPRNIRKKYILQRRQDRRRHRRLLKCFVRFEQKMLYEIEGDLVIERECDNTNSEYDVYLINYRQ